MNPATLAEFEESFRHLSLSEQLRLIERLVHNAQQSALRTPPVFGNDLQEMAADAAVQAELRKIEHEFQGTEEDGLNGY